jgi:hypothetical protein
MAKALTPFEKKRAELLNEMTPKTQAVAKDFDKKVTMAAKGLVLIKYDMGARLAEVIEKEAEYGSDAVNQLATYMNFPGGATGLYALSNFASEFDRDFVQTQVAQAMENGRPLETGHFLQIMRVKSKKEQTKLFDRVRRECLSVNSLEEEIRAKYESKNKRTGGRKPKKPSSPAAGLQKLFANAQKLDNFLDITEETIFEPLEEIAAEEVNEQLVDKFDKAEAQLGSLIKDAQAAVKRMQPVKKRLDTVLKKKANAPEEESAPKSTSRKKAATKKASSKGGTASRKKTSTKKKSARRRPAAV